MTLKQSTAIARPFYMHDTGLTVTVEISKAGAAFAAAAGAVAEIGYGWYKVTLSVVDTGTLGFLVFHCTAAGSDPCPFSDLVEAANLDSIKTDTAAILADTGTDGVVVAAASKAGYTLSAAGVQAIWDALSSALTVVGSIGKRLVDYIDAAISSRSSHSAANVVTAMETDGSKLDHLWEMTEDDAGVRRLTANAIEQAPTAAIADKVLGRNLAGGSDGGRTVTSAFRSVRNKVDTAAVPGYLVVYQEDDLTEDHRRALTTDASAEPVVTADPTT